MAPIARCSVESGSFVRGVSSGVGTTLLRALESAYAEGEIPEGGRALEEGFFFLSDGDAMLIFRGAGRKNPSPLFPGRIPLAQELPGSSDLRK